MCMLHVEVMARLEEIVGEKIGRDERFTAYDVTRELRGESFICVVHGLTSSFKNSLFIRYIEHFGMGVYRLSSHKI